MSGYSMNVEKLTQMVAKMNEIASTYDNKLKAEIARLTIPGGAFPVLDGGASDAYATMQTAAGDASAALADALRDAASAVQKVIDHYKTMEAEHGRAFDTALN
ncbi:hypothetical protein ABZS66_28595 [Dactylosporangium sp. NPDC005572]|uniref:hypothetical protein n=1 Tax=Dactylosporangium sp. NPDC005572 TaxID=3156889 RepID=UPI0033AFC9ED